MNDPQRQIGWAMKGLNDLQDAVENPSLLVFLL